MPPSIPTSFVPHPGGRGERYRADLGNAFAALGYGALALAVVLALSVFAYERVLASSVASKDATLAAAETAIDPAAVEQFVRLRDRLTQSKDLLAAHPAPSGFFSLIESLLPNTVRFTSVHLTRSDRGPMTFEGSGLAKNFNALAAASAAFAKNGRIKDAIFSNIAINKNGSVSFVISAALDPALTAFAPSMSAQGAAASSTAPAAPATP